ncbi:hypothetical protein [Paenibacillus sp.]|uniref:hypothetical protein n=1 Tax=Paenibacillus sp. TaxID=58172 RepID=UPI002D385609|nr:hypothetical protein [Paenibacillus sp.]HZG84193.1 hypothetical protein [Paenibacillus sp.]
MSTTKAVSPILLELCQFRPHPDLPDAEFRSALRTSRTFLENCPGFAGRTLLYSPSSMLWTDAVRWTSPALAQEAFVRMAEIPDLRPLTEQLVDVTMQHVPRVDELTIGASPAPQDGCVYEVLTYRLKPGVSAGEYRAAMAAFGEAVAPLDGFVGREAFYGEESGLWVELIRYADQAAALRLGPIVMELPAAGRLFDAIDQDSVGIHFGSEASL